MKLVKVSNATINLLVNNTDSAHLQTNNADLQSVKKYQIALVLKLEL